MTDFDVRLGARIAEARRTAGVTLDEVAKAMHVTRAAVGHWQRGARSLSAEQVVTIAEILRADPHWLLTGTSQKPNSASAHRIRHAAEALFSVASVLDELLVGTTP